MTDTQSAKLKSLGVPFFGVRPDLVLPDDDESADDVGSPPSDGSGKISKKQLLALQRRMLDYLTDLYGP
jgi:hypothetical protein